MIDRRLSVAPMMDCTDRHFRYLVRLISRHVLLYTEMVTTGAVLHGDRQKLLAFDPSEHPVALQLGGSDAGELAEAAGIGASFGYDEINLNVGCPSDRVQSGRFGACLMAEPETVRDGVAAMAGAVDVPVTVKTRIGIDDRDSYGELVDFIGTVADGGCSSFAIHARKAWLDGLSPKENRTVPELRHDVAARLKQDFPELEIVLNGGIGSLDEVVRHLHAFDGVMLGRAAYRDPFLLADADRRIFGDATAPPDRAAVVRACLPYVERQLAAGRTLKSIARHMTGLFYAQPGGRHWRRHLSEEVHRSGAGVETIEAALTAVTHEAERVRESRLTREAA